MGDGREEPEITIKLQRRPDGGLRVWSPDVPGLILSGPSPSDVMADILPTLDVLVAYRAAREALSRARGE